MKSRNKKRLLALVLCMVVAISNSSFIFASETGQAEYPQEAEVQTQDEAVANDMDVAAYAADEGQAVAEEQNSHARLACYTMNKTGVASGSFS